VTDAPHLDTAERARVILLLEDQALVRAGMRALIQACEPGATIQEAGSYAEALARLEAGPIDIAFLDIDLRESQTGFEVLRHIRAAGLLTRVIMLSAHAEESLVLNCIRTGACGYIQKDMEGDGLFRRALDTVFHGGVFLPSDIFRRDGAAPGPHPGSTSLEALGVKGRLSEALYYICQGYSNAVIAYEMGVAEGTVANEYNSRLFKLFRVSNRARLIVEVAKRGLIVPPPKPRDPRTTTTG
jgi:two-component system nitrate/nitrite response regulator NarL